MTTADFLVEATATLKQAGIVSARLDCLILLEDMLRLDRARLLAHPELELSQAQLSQLNTYIIQRKQHLPLAYIRGKAPFFGREFVVNTDVLVPRPESESMITLLLQLPLSSRPCIADLGTGSGCLGITAALELPDSDIYVYDTSQPALKIAADNAARHNVRVHLANQNVLQHDSQVYDVILANLPYVPNDYPINQAAGHEPAEALFSGRDGLDHYRQLWQQIAHRSAKLQPAYLILESLPEQHSALVHLAKAAGYMLQDTQGYAQCFCQIEIANP